MPGISKQLLTKIEKLNGSNWRTWKVAIMDIFQAESAMGIVEGTIPRPVNPNLPAAPPAAVQRAIATWDISDGICKVIIRTACDPIRKAQILDEREQRLPFCGKYAKYMLALPDQRGLWGISMDE
ncbi:hypothetical protein TWF718_001531 [Orbilia javanica]|uniref:Retrotransposon Copia-like N-terminal domain-containing protein n=1 Tax=Orbilia javanica TaxID=47235 RepID=A0AAN8RN26_9PEZI